MCGVVDFNESMSLDLSYRSPGDVSVTVSSDLMDAAGLIFDEAKAATIGSSKDAGRWIAMIDEGGIEPLSRTAGYLARVMRDYFAEH